jgi:plasmid stability protein
MRTTLDIPDGIGRRVKIAAARRGVSMKALIVEALENELDTRKHAAQTRPLRLPLVSSRTQGCYDLKPEEINDILAREEATAYETIERR